MKGGLTVAQRRLQRLQGDPETAKAIAASPEFLLEDAKPWP